MYADLKDLVPTEQRSEQGLWVLRAQAPYHATTLLYSLGFRKPSKEMSFGISDSAFDFGGAGGSLAFADPDTQTGYAYAPNQAGVYPFDDPREKALRDAHYGYLGRVQ